MSITITNVTKKYGPQLALNNISMTIKSGEIVGFLGPNGAGKSTMMKIITGFIPASEGFVEVCGIDPNKQPLDYRRNIGYLPEHNPLYLDMYVKEYLEFVGQIYKLGKTLNTRIEEVIELTGLTDERHKKISALSKGYRQRVGLAQALLPDPQVLILDEPTTGLDPNQIVEVRNLIKKIGEQKTVMLSTHIMQEVQAICERVIIINKGEIVADALTSELTGLSASKKIQVTLELKETIEKSVLENIPQIENVEQAKGNQWLLIADQDPREAIFNFAVQNNLTLLEMHKTEKSFESIFHELTHEPNQGAN